MFTQLTGRYKMSDPFIDDAERHLKAQEAASALKDERLASIKNDLLGDTGELTAIFAQVVADLDDDIGQAFIRPYFIPARLRDAFDCRVEEIYNAEFR